MGNLLADGAAWLSGQRHAHLASTVVYERGVHSVEAAATIGRTVFEVADEAGFISRIESRDFIVRAADLVLNGAAVLPQRGDRVRETVGPRVFVYEVLSPAGEDVWRFSDPQRTDVRVHTKFVASEDA